MSLPMSELIRRFCLMPGRCRWRATLLAVLSLCGITLNARAQFTRFQSYADEQGLGSSDITTLTQDKDGSILLGTQGGLYRYDGTSFRQDADGLSSEWIVQVATDPAGRIWVVTNQNGLFVSNGSQFRKVDTGTALAGGVIDRFTHLLAVGDGEVVLDAGGTLLRAVTGPQGTGPFQPLFGAAVLAVVPGLKHARFVVPDPPGGLLIGCGDGLCRFAHGHITVFGTADGLPPDAWQAALRTSDGTLWVRSLGRLAWRRPGQAGFTAVAVPGQHTSYFAGSPQDLRLLGDHGNGVLTQGDEGLLDWTGSAWRTYAPHVGGLPAAEITSMLWDREGSLWVGSGGYGAFRSIGLGVWEHWTKEDGLPSSIVWDMTRLPNKRFWVATDAGSVPLGNGTETVAGENLVTVTSGKGQVWLAPSTGPIVRLDGFGKTTARLPPLGHVFSAMVDRQDRLWLSTRTGLFVVPDADASAAALTPRLALSGRRCVMTTDAAGIDWAACQNGVFRWSQDATFQRVISPDHLQDQVMGVSFTDGGELWIGTETRGVLRFAITGAHVEPLPPIILPTIGSNSVLFLHRDRRGWMWAGTDHGIDRFDGHAWHHIDSSDGLISNDLDEYSVLEDTDGSMWFGTTHGLSHLIDPDHLPSPEPLHPQITGLSLGSRMLPLDPLVRIDWSPAPLVVHFNDLDYARERGLVFRYRLRGVDNSWNDTTAHEVRYGQLPAATLYFELVAVDSMHHTISAPVGFTIRIEPPWWQRWWFYGLCLIIGSGVIFAIWQLRERLLLRQRQQLEDEQLRLEEVVRARTSEIEQARDQLQRQAMLEQQRLEQMVEERTAEIEQARTLLQRLAMSDTLTGLPNRRSIMGTLEEAVISAQALTGRLAVMICDIDHFKAINDGFGHLAGDAVLAAFGSRLGSAVCAPEAVGRYGGEEFLAILFGEPDAIRRQAYSLHATISETSYRLADNALDQTVTYSGGLAFLRSNDTSFSLIARADAALYRAKANGRNRIEEEQDETASCEVEWPQDPATALKRDLRLALGRDEFTLHYQPILDVGRNKIVAYEALLRWHSPSRGDVSPARFIPIAEQNGLMTEIDAWVIQTACREAAGWADDVRISVNLSSSHFHQPDLVQNVAAVLAESGLAARRLEIEVTETSMILDVEAAATVLDQLRVLGISIALDDFGTGYSSLSFLRTLPFDRIKIDRSFVKDLGIRPEAAAIIGSVIHLCTGLGTAVTAEGVETAAQVELLRAIGCREMQGYHIGHPGPASSIQVRNHAMVIYPELVALDA